VAADSNWSVPRDLQEAMYARALALSRKNVRGGPTDPTYKQPFVDAAFSDWAALAPIALYGEYIRRN